MDSLGYTLVICFRPLHFPESNVLHIHEKSTKNYSNLVELWYQASSLNNVTLKKLTGSDAGFEFGDSLRSGIFSFILISAICCDWRINAANCSAGKDISVSFRAKIGVNLSLNRASSIRIHNYETPWPNQYSIYFESMTQSLDSLWIPEIKTYSILKYKTVFY